MKRKSENSACADVVTDITPIFINEVINWGSKVFPKKEVETLKACIQCGRCAGSCPSGRRTSWRVREILEKTRLGLIEEVLSNDELWSCTTCYTCQERCPRKVRTTDIVRIIRNLAVKFGRMKEAHRRVCENLFGYGHAVPINDDIKKVRRELGLAESPPTVHSYPESLREVLKIFEKTGFKAKVDGGVK
ncbi:MAG: CoB--CoM heterodisulfide reductase subunit C [Nitrososphaerota archaeon]|nr:CoB--CoM heterodisulfide reductase subunit C [Candidatus Bathyarchaeota archaeon]MDW8022208.1 CoB--CoM heterodisulfide reductase subunit C [Nitrososphaerota archaeon]